MKYTILLKHKKWVDSTVGYTHWVEIIKVDDLMKLNKDFVLEDVTVLEIKE